MKILSISPLIGLASAAADLLFHEDFKGYEYDLTSGTGYAYYSYGTLGGANWTWDVVTASEWNKMSTNDFKQYKAIIIGDPIEADPSYLDPIMGNRKTWGNAIEGNVILIGTDTSYHWAVDGDGHLVVNGIAFAATSNKGTGLYFSLSQYYSSSPTTTVPILDIFGTFQIRGGLDAGTYGIRDCYDDVHIVVQGNPVLQGITDYDLSDWGCSVHEAFVSYPSTGTQSFIPLAIAQDFPENAVSYSDGTSGIPYILVRGASPIGCGNGRVDPGEQCDDGNMNDGDGCNSACRFEGGSGGVAQGTISGSIIGGVAGVAALGGLAALLATKTTIGAKAAAAVGIGSAAGTGGGSAAGGAPGAATAMFVPTGLEGKAAAAVASYVPTGIEGKAAAQVSYMPGLAEKTGFSTAGMPPPTDGGVSTTTAFAPPPTDGGISTTTAFAPPPTDGGLSTSTAAAPSMISPPASPPPIYPSGTEIGISQVVNTLPYVPGSEGISHMASGATAGMNTAASAGSAAAPTSAFGPAAAAPGMPAMGSSMASAPGIIAPSVGAPAGVGVGVGGVGVLGIAAYSRTKKEQEEGIAPYNGNNGTIRLVEQEVIPTPGEMPSDPVSRPIEMEQPYVPPPPQFNSYDKEYR
ncbi:hypothetical protein TWF694_011015 [Orbilia ellipsospora]|uniref:DUF4215 domain-containing protein n=1 Tax=Orbilia ellipsospora TaxID=2528407 RepID=A0AAV9X7R6_9PEZI